VRPGREWLPVATGVTGEQGRELSVTLGTVKNYVNDFFWEAMELYETTELLGPPFAEGWTEWPWEIVVILQTLKAETRRWEYQEYQKKSGR
jgi:hypothetical protein